MTIIETQNLSKRIEKKYIVKDVSLLIPEGSITGLLGPNGAGKSTILKLLIGMLHPTEGKVLYKGNPLTTRDLFFIGSLIDEPALYANLTAQENLKVRTIPLGIENKKIDETLEVVNLSDTKDKKVKHFSLGMKQRLGIAIALINDPVFLILDEPTNGLDPIGMQEFRNLVFSLSDKGVTVLISSHLLKEMEGLANHIAIMTDGCLRYQGAFKQGDDLEALFMNVMNG
ncbi:MAG: ATP-binding cassette domain-containing protein [Tannerellaceae bacterium]|nr:ATP-binding cassette domain-containing protein [Tannerellaceae bacterium]